MLIRRILPLMVLCAMLASTLLGGPAAAASDVVDMRPITADNPRIWPAVSRARPLEMGAVEAFRAPERATEMGVQWQRIMFDWSAIQRSGPSEWDFGWANAQLMSAEHDAGRPAVGLFMSTPSWASGTTDAKSPPRGLEYPVDDPRNVWATWVRSVVGRYAGVIDDWVIWNEPDVWSDETSSRQWDGTPEQYYLLLKVAYQAARSANPDARVLMAGMTYWWDAAYGREQYFSRILRAAQQDPSARANGWYFDGAVLQLYNDPRGLFDAPRIYHEIMRGFGFDKPVWVNETNAVPWDDPVAPLTREHFRATMEEQASFLVQATAYAIAGDVERMAVYKMVDDSPIKRGVEQAFGMVRADSNHTARPIFDTYRLLVREMAPTTRAQLVDQGPVNIVYLEQPSLGRRMTVVWNTSPQPREVSFAGLGGPAQAMDKFGRTRLLAPADDGVVRVTAAPATANTVPGYPNTYFIGGDPVMVLEPMESGYTPLEPTLANLPLAARPTPISPASAPDAAAADEVGTAEIAAR